MTTETTKLIDLRVDLILRVQQDHMFKLASSKDSPSGERYKCGCGEDYKGNGALKQGQRHIASEVLDALDAAAGVA